MKFMVEVIPRKDDTCTKTAWGHIYFNVPTQAEIDNAYLQVEAACNTAVVEKYGKWEIAKERLAAALDSLKQSNTAFHMLVAKYAADLSKEKNSPMFCGHSVSIIDYLLDISPLDPLPPHYYCPDCQHIETSDNAADGLDLTYKKCPICGKEMLRSGHNFNEAIAWTVLRHSRFRTYQIAVTIPVLLELQARLDRGLYHTECTPDTYCNITLTSYGYINRIFELQNITGKDISDIPLDNRVVWFKTLQNFLIERSSELEFNVRIDKFPFSDLLQVVGLEYARYDSKSIEMINNPEFPLFRDDCTTGNVYMFYKSACLEAIIPGYYMEWYKDNFSKEFETVTNNA